MSDNTTLKFDDLYVGRIDAKRYGYARGTLKVTIDVEIKRDGAVRETIEHEAISNPLCFSMSVGVWNQRETDHIAGGQDRDVLKNLATFAPGFDAAKTARLVGLWERWHLNTMKAGCAHVEPVYTTDRYGRRVADLENTPECPVERYTSKPDGSDRKLNHYRYGHAWLTEPLPEGFTDELRSILPGRIHPLDEEQQRMSTGSRSLADMMRRDGIGATIARKPQAPRRATWGQDADWWTAYFRGPGRPSMTTSFALGKGHDGRKPTATEILSTVIDEARGYDNATSFEDWAAEFGYEPDDKNARRTYNMLEQRTARLRVFLGEQYEEYTTED